MLERTGKDLGAPTKIYVDGQAFSFCSAVTSRNTMEADTHNMAYCPYTLVAYAILKEPHIVHVAYRRPRDADSDTSRSALEELEIPARRHRPRGTQLGEMLTAGTAPYILAYYERRHQVIFRSLD